MDEDEFLSDFKEVELTKVQKFLAILGIVLVILANTNPHFNSKDLGVKYANVKDLYFASFYTEGEHTALGIFNNLIPIK